MNEIFERWLKELYDKTPRRRYVVGEDNFKYVPLEPKKVILLGAPPAFAKTCLVMQWGFDALRYDPSLRMVVCNVEMPSSELLNRQLARMAKITVEAIEEKTCLHEERVKDAIKEVLELESRIRFVEFPFTLENVAKCDEGFLGHIWILDYIQRIPTNDEPKDLRLQLVEAMNNIRQAANDGRAIIVVSEVNRGNGNKPYENVGLGSFKESGALEYGADTVYVLNKVDGSERDMVAKNEKSRYSKKRDIDLQFAFPEFIPSKYSKMTQEEYNEMGWEAK